VKSKREAREEGGMGGGRRGEEEEGRGGGGKGWRGREWRRDQGVEIEFNRREEGEGREEEE